MIPHVAAFQMGFLTAVEAANLLGTSVEVKVDSPLPVTIQDPHIPSRLLNTLQIFCASQQVASAVFICAGKSVVFASLGYVTLYYVTYLCHLHDELRGGNLVGLGHRFYGRLCQCMPILTSDKSVNLWKFYTNILPITTVDVHN